ncbi:TonB-dependent receptor [Tenacibaculum caenipelagi]|uniref:Carboxypeptidase-like protein n=1 Tax=Tenacibaculum caenipelagi TaxID=1325435 RepID=A0A4V3D360_9FLAO|nr:TonB-dependent receptor [Tenacibaculum caenipelagi]TDQ28374.1 carboxypeptidase-like protein [Tenacibaculum caenipelagi]
MFKKLLSILFIACSVSFYGQTTINGKVYDEYLEPFSNAVVVSGDARATSDFDGNFTLTVKENFPFEIQVSAFGYKTEIIEVATKDQEINVILKENVALDEVVISASRSPERVIESPVTIERMGEIDIKRNTSPSFYDGLVNLKGIESREANYGFKSINARGFSTFDNTRFVQLVDGVETSIPALNFSAGNLVGLSDLDVKNVEILPGASSALYGANAFNGILLMRSKNPFDKAGISTYIKTGTMSQEEAGNNPFYDAGVRMAYKFNNYIAGKVNLTYFSAEEWHANDTSNTTGIGGTITDGDRDTAIDYDGVNVYGDEISYTIPGIGKVSRTGYDEKDLTNYNGYNLKFDGSLHIRPWANDALEIVLNTRYSRGDNTYQGTNRFSQKGYFIEQYKLEFLGKNFFVRGYYTGNDSGKSHDLRFAAIALNEKYNSSKNWFGEYATVFSTTGSDEQARNYANRNRFVPGTVEFKNALEEVINTPINEGGAAIKDQTSFYHADANYNFRDIIRWGEIQIGGSYRKYDINSNGTLFTDENSGITFDMVGAYSQIQKKFLDDRLKLTGSVRYDKSKNFEGNFSPRVAVNYSLGQTKNHILRASYQTGFRNPSITEQYFGLRSGPSKYILGTSNENIDRFSTTVLNQDGTTNEITGSDAFGKSFENLSNLVKIDVDPIKPEQVTSYEVGYRSIIDLDSKSLLELDINGYYNQYENFVAFKNVFVPNYGGVEVDGTPDAQADAAFANGDYTEFVLNTNTSADIDSYGIGIGLNTKVFKTFNFGANYTYTKLVFDQSTDPTFKSGFNTPEHQVKVMFGNQNLFNNFGFNINLRWQNEFLWQSSFLDATVDSRTVLDAQMNYRVPAIKSRFKIGGTNLTGKEYMVAPGSGLIGSMYYVSWIIND